MDLFQLYNSLQSREPTTSASNTTLATSATDNNFFVELDTYLRQQQHIGIKAEENNRHHQNMQSSTTPMSRPKFVRMNSMEFLSLLSEIPPPPPSSSSSTASTTIENVASQTAEEINMNRSDDYANTFITRNTTSVAFPQ